MAGRTVNKWLKVYLDGYDVTGSSRTVGPLGVSFDEVDLLTIGDAVKGILPGHASISAGALNVVMDNTASTGFHTLFSASPGAKRNLMVAVGIQAAPAQGDPVFMAQPEQKDYIAENGGVYFNMAFDMPSITSTSLAYDIPWGSLLRPANATTAVNSSVGIDDTIAGAATAFGGYMMYQVIAGNGTATIKVQHASTNSDGSFADLGGCTTGSINCAIPQYGIVTTTARTTSVNRYLRWQIVLGTATSVTFALGFHRALR
jgi:hypothetical protein